MNHNTNHIAIVVTLIASMIMNVLLLCIHNSAVDSAYEYGRNKALNELAGEADSEYIKGLHSGLEAADQTLYATCEDEMLASQYPDGFCAGVDMYLGL